MSDTDETKTCASRAHIGPFTEYWKVGSHVRNIGPDEFDQATGAIEQSVYAGSEMIWNDVTDNIIDCEACDKSWPVESSVAQIE
jgi:hypothetical protein